MAAFKGEPVLWMPYLSVRVRKGHQQTPRFPAVVDSGSPYWLFRADVADYLGIDLTRGVKDFVGGVTTAPSEPIFFHKVNIVIESDWVIQVMAGFVKKPSVAGILGRNGFFDNFYVKFDYSVKPSEMEVAKIEHLQ